MFVNKRRVNLRDMKNIANANLRQREEANMICYNRMEQIKDGKHRNTQAKRHRGKMLFYTRKPLEAEDNCNESTHYQRAHKKHVVRQLFSMKVGIERK